MPQKQARNASIATVLFNDLVEMLVCESPGQSRQPFNLYQIDREVSLVMITWEIIKYVIFYIAILFAKASTNMPLVRTLFFPAICTEKPKVTLKTRLIETATYTRACIKYLIYALPIRSSYRS